MLGTIAGYKSYIVCGAAGLVWTLTAVDIMPDPIALKAYTALAVMGGGTMAAKINRLGAS